MDPNDRLFGGKIPNIDVIVGHVVDQPMPAPTEAGSSRYRLEDFTESQSVEGKEYAPSTQFPEIAPQEVHV